MPLHGRLPFRLLLLLLLWLLLLLLWLLLLWPLGGRRGRRHDGPDHPWLKRGPGSLRRHEALPRCLRRRLYHLHHPSMHVLPDREGRTLVRVGSGLVLLVGCVLLGLLDDLDDAV